MNADEFRGLPEGPPYAQLIEGLLVEEPSPELAHQNVLSNLARPLLNYCVQHRIGKVFFAPLDVYLSESTVLQPDLLYISNERRSLLANSHVDGPPDLVVEILSPSTAGRDLRVKRSLYQRYGVRECWIIDPLKETVCLSAFIPGGEAQDTLIARGGVLTSRLFPELQIEVSSLFVSF